MTSLNIMYFYIKLFMLFAFLVLSNTGFIKRVASIGIQSGLVIYLFIWLIALFAILAVAFHKNTVSKITWSILFVILAALSKAYFNITSSYLTISDFEMLINLIGFTDDAIFFYGNRLMSAYVLALIGIIAMLMPPLTEKIPGKNKQIMLLPLIPVLLTSVIVYARGGNGANGLPDYSNIMSFATVLSIDSLVTEKNIPKKPIHISSKYTDRVKNIVFIMDESIRGDFLGINNKDGVPTSIPRDMLANFGIASSASNCSTASNISVRYGANKETYLKDIKSNPSLWEYAKHAGYKTTYIDGQRSSGNLMNLMTQDELHNIDRFIQLDKKTLPENKDTIIANRIRDILNNGNFNFIYINKMGAHFPYEGKYPASQRVYAPTMKRNYFGNESDPKIDSSYINIKQDQDRLINSYRNAVYWNVSHFFTTLLDQLNLDNTIIIYTSDHGQNFSRIGNHGLRTHCTLENAPPEEGIIPFMVLTENKTYKEKLSRFSKINFNNVSHFNIYPTILVFMGYMDTDIKLQGHIENNILETLPKHNRKFISYFFTRFGKKPIWVEIE